MTELDWLLAFTLKCIQAFLMAALGGLVLGIGVFFVLWLIYQIHQSVTRQIGRGEYDDWP
jgi:hypothetical protein